MIVYEDVQAKAGSDRTIEMAKDNYYKGRNSALKDIINRLIRMQLENENIAAITGMDKKVISNFYEERYAGPSYEVIDNAWYRCNRPTYRPKRIAEKITNKFYKELRHTKYMVVNNVTIKCKIGDLKQAIKPSLMVINRNKIIETRINDNIYEGIPEMIVEVVGDSSIDEVYYKNYIKKMNLYKELRVKEFWVVDAYKESITAYGFENEGFNYCEYVEGDIIASKLYPDISFKLDNLFNLNADI